MYHLFAINNRKEAQFLSKHFTEVKALEAQHRQEKWRKKKGLYPKETVIALCREPGKEIITLQGDRYNVVT